MSERGSFCTEYIYCNKCFNACKTILNGNDKWLHAIQIAEFPIIAGKIGGLYSGEEIVDMEDYIFQIQEKMCPDCTLRISVLAERGSVIYEFNKKHIRKLCEEQTNE